ncbi:MAG: hypothetical protein AAGB12_16355 [Pseudomonadota bacterium]
MMNNLNQSKTLSSRKLPLWRRVTGYFSIFILLFQWTSPAVASVIEFLPDDVINQELASDEHFQVNAKGTYSELDFLKSSESTRYYSAEDFYQRLYEQNIAMLGEPTMVPIMTGDITLVLPIHEQPKLVGSTFVQSRYIRTQIWQMLGRSLIFADKTEAQQIQDLYNKAFTQTTLKTTGFSHLTYGDALKYPSGDAVSRINAPADMIWPEKRVIRGQTVIVPILYLTILRTVLSSDNTIFSECF